MQEIVHTYNFACLGDAISNGRPSDKTHAKGQTQTPNRIPETRVRQTNESHTLQDVILQIPDRLTKPGPLVSYDFTCKAFVFDVSSQGFPTEVNKRGPQAP